jgi:hypothetical protein
MNQSHFLLLTSSLLFCLYYSRAGLDKMCIVLEAGLLSVCLNISNAPSRLELYYTQSLSPSLSYFLSLLVDERFFI